MPHEMKQKYENKGCNVKFKN